MTTPPTTDFRTVVTEPGVGSGGGAGSAGGAAAPVCVWVVGGLSELDAVARNSGVAAQMVRETAEDHVLLVYRCDGRWDGRTWRWAVPVTAGDLARDGLVELSGRLPVPVVGSVPAVGRASIAAVAVLVWTDPAGWVPVVVTRVDPLSGLSVTATATPVAMWFDPGDGSGRVGCGGPGVAYDGGLAGGDANVQLGLPGRCGHVYERVTVGADGSPVAGRPGAWSAELGVVWEVSWVATNGESGSFAPITKTASFQRPVTEVQVLVTG